MQTFLPHPSFVHSAAVLDTARLGKQRLECFQLLRVLESLRNESSLPADFPTDLAGMVGARRRNGYRSHPAARMWRGYESALGVYMTFMLREWELRGYRNNFIHPYTADWKPNPALDPSLGKMLPIEQVVSPEWLGENVFHAGHRARLLHKNPEWYGQFGWSEHPSLEYTWPHQLAYVYH